jgi:hypothetical protein
MTYGFLMSIIYVVAIVSVILRLKILYILLAIVEAILLFVLFLFWILAVYMAAAQPPEGVDIVYDLFPQDGNYIESKFFIHLTKTGWPKITYRKKELTPPSSFLC